VVGGVFIVRSVCVSAAVSSSRKVSHSVEPSQPKRLTITAAVPKVLFVKLFRSASHPGHWIGEDPQSSSVLWIWPAEPGGWLSDLRRAWTAGRRGLEKAEPALARGTGWPGAGGGRPRRVGAEVSAKRLTLRATADEMAAWEERAEAEGKPLAGWSRDELNAAVERARAKKSK